MCESLLSLSTVCELLKEASMNNVDVIYSAPNCSDFTPSVCRKLERRYKHCWAWKRLTANQKCNVMFLVDNSESWRKESCGQEVWGWTSNIILLNLLAFITTAQQGKHIQLYKWVLYVPCRRSVEVSEVWVKDSDAVVAHHVDEVYISQSGSELPDHLPPVLQQHGVQLAFVPAQRDVPGQDVVSVSQVENCGQKDQQQAKCSLFISENGNRIL